MVFSLLQHRKVYPAGFGAVAWAAAPHLGGLIGLESLSWVLAQGFHLQRKPGAKQAREGV